MTVFKLLKHCHCCFLGSDETSHHSAQDPKILGDGIDQTLQRTNDPDTLSHRGYRPTTLPCTAEGWNTQFHPTTLDPQTSQKDHIGPQKLGYGSPLPLHTMDRPGVLPLMGTDPQICPDPLFSQGKKYTILTLSHWTPKPNPNPDLYPLWDSVSGSPVR